MLIAFLILIAVFRPLSINAANEFDTSQNIVYSIDDTGNARVNQEIKLTNNLSQIYAKEYHWTITDTNIANITATDNYGSVLDKVVEGSDKTEIYVKFPTPSIGKGQAKLFTITYSIKNLSKKKGNTWEIQLPQLSNTEMSTSQVTLEVPSNFGELSFSSIPINNSYLTGTTNRIKINNSEVNKKILLVFGNHQLFDFKLLYSLSNNNQDTTAYKIPIPPNTENQKVTYSEILPRPQSIDEDADGNWIASYLLTPSQQVDIVVKGQVKVHPPTPLRRKPETGEYLEAQKYWPVDDSQITSISSGLSNPKSIYSFVVDKLDYNYEKINSAKREGAIYALTNPTMSLCTEFTDLFVTLARAKGIPAREIEGFAFSNDAKIKPVNINSDILHAWPEYFNSENQMWTQVDPTWAKTTNGINYFDDLDLNHIAFVIHGKKSDAPAPPGAYKKDPAQKTIFVDFAQDEIVVQKTALSISLDNNIISISNPDLSGQYNLSLSSNNPKWNVENINIPPLGKIDFKLPKANLINTILNQPKKTTFTIISNDSPDPTYITVPNRQYYLFLSIEIGIVILLLSLGGIILTTNFRKK